MDSKYKNDNLTYRYSGSAWVAISANAIPKATQSLDGCYLKKINPTMMMQIIKNILIQISLC